MIFSLLYEKQRSKLGLVTLDVLMTEELDLPSEVTQYPVEDGGPDISDHITQGTETLTITGKVSHANVEAFELGATSTKLIDVLETFRGMHSDRKPITVVTGLGIYDEMGFAGLTLTRVNSSDTGGNWLEIKANLVKVIKVALEQGDLPPEQVNAGDNDGKTKGKSGGTEKKGNNSGKSAKEPSEASKKTIFKSLSDRAGATTPGSGLAKP